MMMVGLFLYLTLTSDLTFACSAITFYDITFTRDFRVEINSNGRILWTFGGNFATSCTLDMTYYPFDKQTCNMIIGNWAYTNDSVRLTSLTTQVTKQVITIRSHYKLYTASVHTKV